MLRRFAIVVSVLGLPLIAQQGKPPTPAAPKLLVTDADKGKPWPLAATALPKFPELPAGKAVEGGECHELELESARGKSKVWVYVPTGSKPKSNACVVIAPAGSNLLFGMTLGDGDRKEHLPWLQAGFVVVAYEVDGVMPEEDQQTDANIMRQARAYNDSLAGMLNARAALEFALAKVPAIDGKRLFAAGHSSAATTALLFAAHEPRLRGVAAFMPVVDVSKRLPKVAQDQMEKDFPGYRNFIVRSSPHTHLAGYRMPLFVFAAEDDENTPFADTKAFAEQLKAAKKDVTFDHVATGNHYEPMLDPGIPHAIAWAQKLAAAPAAAPGAPKPPTK
jgi:dipeptidyl aminopeptidase/acylaminoacyl peptidase